MAKALLILLMFFLLLLLLLWLFYIALSPEGDSSFIRLSLPRRCRLQ